MKWCSREISKSNASAGHYFDEQLCIENKETMILLNTPINMDKINFKIQKITKIGTKGPGQGSNIPKSTWTFDDPSIRFYQ